MLALSATGAAMADDSRYVIKVDNSKKGVVKALAKKMGGEINIDANGFIAATFDGKDLAAVKGLLNNPHIQLIEEDQRRMPMALFNDDVGNPDATQLNPYAIYQSQADQLSLQMNSAKTVCIIDSGIARETGETGGYNPDFHWSNISGTSDSGTGDWFRDGGPHGTHVAGTIAAADNSYGVKGMAPGNPLHIIKVFNDTGWGYSSDLAVAAQKCTEAGASIISMSLGGGGANSTEENAFNAFTDNGGLVLAAAGNDGNTTRSYPAGYPSVMMIGANDGDNNIADFSQYPSCLIGRGGNAKFDEGVCVEATAGGVNTLSTYPSGGATLASLTVGNVAFPAAGMENQGEASGSTYDMGLGDSIDLGASGKICLIDRGSVSFYDKVNNCEKSEGIGAIIINNESGVLYGTLGDTNDTFIPAVGAALEDRAALMAASTASVSVGNTDYGYMSGTSMATPGVSGIAALVWSNHPSCSGSDIRGALKATAFDAGAAGHDVYFGHGIVKAKAASDYLTDNGCSGGTVDNAPAANFAYSCSELSCDFTDGSSDDNGINSYSWTFGDGNSSSSQNPIHSFAADGSYTVTLTVTDTAGQTDSSSQTVSVSSGATGGSIELNTLGFKVKGSHYIDLSWSGASNTNVDIYRNGSKISTTANDGAYRDATGYKGGAVYYYQVCDSGTSNCSAEKVVVF